ncbi:NUDIX hydrolase [Streptomyces sp. P6-2-1]|uniref:NUDIX hydrolase n=1 Tax=Streptomyces sp. P6-2-1 TaxID=3422591 RepID=UPI003D35C483
MSERAGKSTGAQWFPADWPDRIRAHARGDLVPVPPRRAATVLLLREAPDGPGGLLVHMLRRRASMAFAAGAYAYPGGGVDPRDSETAVRWAGPSPAAWAERLGLDEEGAARAVVCAAVRETFEECGVLLAGPDAETVVADVSGPEWEAERAALVAHETSFAAFLNRHALVLRSDLLGGWARWITPEFEARRYDTWFFVAALPEGQRTREVSTEADRTEWVRPVDALHRYAEGALQMMPPTVATLRDLVPYGSVPGVMADLEGRALKPVLAEARLDGDEVVLTWPGHEEFTRRVPGGGPGGLSGGSPGGGSPGGGSSGEGSPGGGLQGGGAPGEGAPGEGAPGEGSVGGGEGA